jgi:hypothetical protein
VNGNDESTPFCIIFAARYSPLLHGNDESIHYCTPLLSLPRGIQHKVVEAGLGLKQF